MRPADLLRPTPSGLYCPPGDFFIDPMKKAARAVITHGHADHARSGHGEVFATPETLAIMAARYGKNFTQQRRPTPCGESVSINGVTVTLIPAGHVLGSAQAVVEKDGLRIIASGDYKRRADPTCPPFEARACDVYVTEATFGVPVFRHPPVEDEIAKLIRSRALHPKRLHLVSAYSLGKAQRMIALLRAAGVTETIYVNKPAMKLCEVYEEFGVALGPIASVETADASDLAGAIALAPASALDPDAVAGLARPVTVTCSGWNRVRKLSRGGADLALVISDHADWDELTATAKEIAPEELWITYGRADALIRWADGEGMKARALKDVA
ncbi:MAG: ligase-associated DNA damage response exonuclease [Maricaulaceae bacterium]|jgi:putative mRNA 3-end processing factor